MRLKIKVKKVKKEKGWRKPKKTFHVNGFLLNISNPTSYSDRTVYFVDDNGKISRCRVEDITETEWVE